MNKIKLAISIFLVIVLSACSSLPAQSIKGDRLKIVQLSDIHFDSTLPSVGSRMYGSSQELFQSAIEDINAMKDVDMVVTSGDNITRPSQSELFKFIKQAKQIKAPFYTTIGNHDVGMLGNSSKRFYFKTLKEQYPDTITPEGENTYYISNAIKGYKFIFLDGVVDSSVTSQGCFLRKQLAWLDKTLSDNADYKIVLVQHHPVVPPFEGGDHWVFNSNEYLNVIDKHKNVVAVLSGHYHCVKASVRNNVAHLSAPALVQYPNAYRVLTFKDKGKCTVVSSEFKNTRLVDVQKKSRDAMKKNRAIYSGQPKDQNFVLTLCP